MDLLLDLTYRAEQRHFWFRGFRRFVRPLVMQATAGLEKPRLLDCGCGTGANLELLDRYGGAFGFDLTSAGLRLARGQGRTRVARASVTHAPFKSATFDVVTSFDVLYCLEDPDEAAAIAEMYRVLKPGGAAIINVAAMSILRGNHSILGGEVRRYSRARLRAALERAGFEVIRLTHTNASLFPLMLAVRTWQHVIGLNPPERATWEITVPAAPVNALLSGILALEAVALRFVDFPIGSSVLCLARKPP